MLDAYVKRLNDVALKYDRRIQTVLSYKPKNGLSKNAHKYS